MHKNKKLFQNENTYYLKQNSQNTPKFYNFSEKTHNPEVTGSNPVLATK